MNESIVRIKIPCVFIANMNMKDNILYDRGMCFYFLIKIEKKLWSVCTYFGHSFYYKNSHLFMTCCALFSFLMFIMWLLHSSTSNTWRAIKIVNTLIFDFWHLCLVCSAAGWQMAGVRRCVIRYYGMHFELVYRTSMVSCTTRTFRLLDIFGAITLL